MGLSLHLTLLIYTSISLKTIMCSMFKSKIWRHWDSDCKFCNFFSGLKKKSETINLEFPNKRCKIFVNRSGF